MPIWEDASVVLVLFSALLKRFSESAELVVPLRLFVLHLQCCTYVPVSLSTS